MILLLRLGDIRHWTEGISVKEAQVHLIQGFGVLKSKLVPVGTVKVHLVQGSGSLVVATVAVERNSFNVRSHLFSNQYQTNTYWTYSKLSSPDKIPYFLISLI